MEVTQQLYNMHLTVHDLHSRKTREDRLIITVTITINSLDHLQSIMNRLSNISGVLQIRRA